MSHSNYEEMLMKFLRKNRKKTADWRHGPAQLWYDMLNVSRSGEGFDYGFKMKKISSEQKPETKNLFPDESFLLVAQNRWEDDVIWDVDRVETMKKSDMKTSLDYNALDNSYSMFPVENEELIYGTWEDEVIWDSDAVSCIPKPKILTLDPNDENIILGIPDDVDPQKQRAEVTAPTKMKVTHPHIKKSKLLLGKAGVIHVQNDDTPSPSSESLDQDPFNISNDSYYYPQSSETRLTLRLGGANLIHHSTPVVELRTPFIQTQTELISSKNSHRPPLRRYSYGINSQPGPHYVMSLTKYIRRKAKMREQERIASGGGDMFFMRTPEDLTGRDGELILIEFCEEHPPLINQVGMCSRVKNYYKRKANKDEGPTHYRYGEITYAHKSPFLGTLSPGQSMQVIENNLYSAPIYEHKIQETDFLVIRTRNQYFIREYDALFTAGQLCPLYEVPGPNSKQANIFIRDFLQVFIYRLFWRSKDTPKRIRMDDIKKAFPSHKESSIRKRLKLCANFNRTGYDSKWWVLKPEVRLPPEEEIRTMVSPEQCCAYYSMIEARQRLKEAGYGEKFSFIPEDDDEDLQSKMDDEEKMAPWNTTRAYIQAMKGKCLLQLTGPTDPTGCGEGFSYVRMPIKPAIKQGKELQELPQKRMVTGTDADLRKLSLEKAKRILRGCGIPEADMKKLSRWEIIDLVRTVSTEMAKTGEGGMSKYSRGNRFSAAEHQERYKEECQRIFDLQNRVLSSAEVLSTDEGETSEDEDSFDIEEMGKNIENLLTNKKMAAQISTDQEEQERQELRRFMLSDGNRKTKDVSKGKRNLEQSSRVLKIYRTFQDCEGKEFTRMEVVRNQGVIDAYLKVRATKNENLMKHLTAKDTAQKDEIRRQKRRMREQLRRNKRNVTMDSAAALAETNEVCNSNAFPVEQLDTHSRESNNNKEAANTIALSRKARSSKMKADLKVKCGACGATGHMRTNRACPLYASNNTTLPAVNVALTQEQEDGLSKLLNEHVESLINVEGTKVKISGKLLKHTEGVKRRALQLKFPKGALVRKRRRLNTADHLDYLKTHPKPINRRRTDPLVDLSTVLESILNELRTLPGVQPFLFPVSAKCVPDYYNIVVRPMDLQTMRENLRQRVYQTREDFLSDVNQILVNSTLYNGAKSQLTLAAKNLLEICVDRLAQNEDKLMMLEKMINPLLDDDDQVALSFILSSIVDKLTVMSESWPFAKPVNKNVVKDYYDVVKHPMDLETIRMNVKAHKYHSREEFLNDIKLILSNCIAYNGRGSSFSMRAEILLNVAQNCLEKYDDHLNILEQNIELVQRKAVFESLNAPWNCIDDNQNQEYLEIMSPLMAARPDRLEFDDIEVEHEDDFIKAEILADDLHCSSEDDGDADNDMMEVEMTNDFDDLTYTHDPITNVATGYSYFTNQNLKPAPTENSCVEDLSFGDNFLFHKDEMEDDFNQYQEMMNSLSYQELDDDNFDMIGLEGAGERHLNEMAEKDITSYTITSADDENNSDNLWF